MQKRDVLLNVIAFADYQLVNNTEKVVFGVDSLGISYILEPNGRFSTSNESVVITRVSEHLYTYIAENIRNITISELSLDTIFGKRDCMYYWQSKSFMGWL